jgi:general secretion pathway protein C
LLATVLANRPEWSMCTLRDLTANDTSVYMVGDEFMGATVLEIQDLKAIILNGGHREFIDLEVGGAGAPAPIAAAAGPAKPTADGIKKIDDKHYQIERSTVNSALANLNDLAMQARIVPSFKNGQANGFKLFSIRPDSLYSKIGVQNGDVIQAINGFDMNSPDKALEAYTKLRNASALDLQIERGGQTMSMHYGIQ